MNMNRRKSQQIYRPGSGSLRKSATFEESESDTNLLINKSHPRNINYSESRFHSEENSPRNFDIKKSKDNLSDALLKNSRRNKKPDQEIYVPRVAQTKKFDQENYTKPPLGDKADSMGDNDRNSNYNSNGYDKKHDVQNSDRFPKSNKRYSNKRRGNDNKEYRENWEDKSFQNRHIRQGSEPRSVNHSNWHRDRDTRSVEPFPPSHSRTNENKYPSKPPSGRRHSTIAVDRINELAPRFLKKLMEEGKIPKDSKPIDDWDGNSMTFKGSNNQPSNYNRGMKYSVDTYTSLPTASINHNTNYGYATLPHRTRGRGRFNDYYKTPVGRPVTPSDHRNDYRNPRNSRPVTPTHFDNQTRNDNSRPQTPNCYRRYDDLKSYGQDNRYRKTEEMYTRNYDSYNNYLREDFKESNSGSYLKDEYETAPAATDTFKVPQPVSSEKDKIEDQMENLSIQDKTDFEEKTSPVVFKMTDWNEELKMNDQLEQENSDALSRSSSVNSLCENSSNVPTTPGLSGKKYKKRNKRRSKRRDMSRERSSEQNVRPNNNFSFENFRIPSESYRRRRRSRDPRDTSNDRFRRSNSRHTRSRESSFERSRRTSTSECENWREEIRSRRNSEKEQPAISRNVRKVDDLSNIDLNKAGVLVVNNKDLLGPNPSRSPETKPPSLDRSKYPDIRRNQTNSVQIPGAKHLFDPNNPNKPIIIKSPNSRAKMCETQEVAQNHAPPVFTDQFGNVCPNWYDENSEEFRLCHFPNMIRDVIRADQELQYIINSGMLLRSQATVENLRQFLKDALQYFICKDLKFSQQGNVETHFWKLLYYHIIEKTRIEIVEDEANAEHYKKLVLYLVEDGTRYFERLLTDLEETYQFKLNDFLGPNHALVPKGLGYVGLALVSAQKIFIFLGDLARYREALMETTNYGKCRQWYIKAQEINPKNGLPYNKLACLAVNARRKLDAVYYFMRSLMSSNPINSVKESLTALLGENSKKYDQSERKRREERLERARQHMKEKESELGYVPSSVRKETWIRPDGGPRVHRTTQAILDQKDSEEEDLAALSSIEVNKRFVISYLHIHGKLIMKIGMDSFQEAAMQMLKEFRALLQHSPLPIPTNRLLQLLALNMYAIKKTQLKDPQFKQLPGYRSEHQERALVVSMQMFNLILERCVSLLEEHLAAKSSTALSLDLQALLPPIKIWCDWMLCHSSVWNPPPSTQDFRVGSPGDAWTRLALLMNLLAQFDQSIAKTFVNERREDFKLLRLPEDGVLSGFTPLAVNVDEPIYVPKNCDLEQAEFVLRLRKLLFFGTEFLCGLEPPVLKLEIENDFREYVSVVSDANSRDSPQPGEELRVENEVLIESLSGDEGESSEAPVEFSKDATSEVRDLLSRKVELERKKRKQEMHMERVKKILSQSVVSVQIDILPKYLVPDTNCFIDYLDQIKAVINVPGLVYTVMVPIVVLGELEGLSKGVRSAVGGATCQRRDADHVRRVGDAASRALAFLKGRKVANVKCVTSKGRILASTTFTTEDDSTAADAAVSNNDDKILSICALLCQTYGKERPSEKGEPRHLFREIVLLTDDRNLRVKALSRDVPVRDLPDFMKWAGLG